MPDAGHKPVSWMEDSKTVADMLVEHFDRLTGRDLAAAKKVVSIYRDTGTLTKGQRHFAVGLMYRLTKGQIKPGWAR